MPRAAVPAIASRAATVPPARPSVVLFYPRTGWDREGMVSLPLSVLSVGSYLEAHGVRVRIVDERVEPSPLDALASAIRELEPAYVGVSSMTGFQIRGALAAAQTARALAPRTPIVWGGVHPSLMAEQTLAHPLADAIVRGEGEATALELVAAVGAGREPWTVAGVSARDAHGLVRHAPDRPFLDLDALPRLSTELVDFRRYRTRQVLGDWDLRIATSRGCPHACSYCYNVPFNNRRWRAQSPARVLEELDHLAAAFDVRAFYVGDDDFFANRHRVNELCERLIARGSPYRLKANCLLEYLVRIDAADLALWRRAGFVQLYVGVETASPEILDSVNKRIVGGDVREANRKLARVGIVPVYSFMAGFPEETPERLQATLDLMRALKRDHPAARLTQLHLLAVYPGTPLFPKAEALGVKLPQTLEAWSRYHWNRIDYPWLDARTQRFLRNASLFTGFVDGRTLAEYLLDGVAVRGLVRAYGALVRARIALRFYRFMPEIRLLASLIRRRLEAPAA
ncbi:MAG: radical SAM protein [bacterium]